MTMCIIINMHRKFGHVITEMSIQTDIHTHHNTVFP